MPFNPETDCDQRFSQDGYCDMRREGVESCDAQCELTDVDQYFREAGLPENPTNGQLVMFAESMVEITNLSANPEDLNG